MSAGAGQPAPALDAFCRALEGASGLRYDASKAYLFESRLRPLFPEGLPGYPALAALVRGGGEPARRVVEALVTHETFFFRDEATFAALPALAATVPRGRGEPLVIWSVGASTGQELFSALFALEEARPGAWREVEAYGLDLSAAAIARARDATYTGLEVGRGLTPARRDAFLEPAPGGWRVQRPWRDLPAWHVANVVEGLPPLPRPHVVFCRNMLIYFAEATRDAVLRALAARLAPGGTLLLGASEAILATDVVARVGPDRHYAYRRADGPRAG